MSLTAFFIAAILFGSPPRASLEACLRGDAQSLRVFVRHFTPIFRYRARLALGRARGALPSGAAPELVDDLVQRTFEVLFRDDARALRQYDPDRGMSLEGYLGRIASRESQNYVQRAFAAKRGGGHGEVTSDPLDGPIARHSEGTDPEAAMASRQRLERLEAALLAQLSPKGRMFYSLMYVEGLDPEEVVDALGVSRDVVYTWRKRIKAALKEALSALDAEDAGGAAGASPAGGPA